MEYVMILRWVRALLAAILAGIPSGTPVAATPEVRAMPVHSASATPTQKARAAMQVVWSDDFDGAAGSYPDAAKWDPRVTDVWQNPAELQNYTRDPRNAHLDGSGRLVINAIRESSGGKDFSSARFRGLHPFLYGLFEARIQFPHDQGIWPAFWLIGPDANMGWPYCGEIDIAEAPVIGAAAQYTYAGTHTPSNIGNDVKVGVSPVLTTSGQFHVYAVDWQRDSLEWFIDGQSIGKITRASVESAGGKWVFNALPEVPVLNLAVGGWAGTPGTWSMEEMLVDYVRVWQ